MPIFKKGDRSNLSNYRPISLTCITGKVMEAIIKEKMVDYLDSNNILRDSQHGFRRGRSCLTNLLEFFEEATQEVDDKKAYDVIYLDFQKAFGVVPHKRLSLKLKATGILGTVATWIDNWLTDRKQRVVIRGSMSQWACVHSGVPQGSILGPLLFLIYINDIDTNIYSKLVKFADDTKVGGVADTELAAQQLQRDLNLISDWADTWQMKFNIDKCKVLHVGSRNIKYRYFMGPTEIKVADYEKDLGVYVDASMSHSRQCGEAIKKANRMLGYISRCVEFKSREVMLRLYNSLVRPHLEYCVQVWSPYLKKDIAALEKVQRRATRMIPGLRGMSYEERLFELNLFSLKQRRLRGDMIQVYKILTGLDAVQPNSYFSISSNTRTRGHRWKLAGEHFKLDLRKHFFTQCVVRVWNSLPDNVVQAESLGSFKSELDKILTTLSY
uniref:Reverse transcriptase domain-containing protein n=1 Tax=Paramormyrops kingsleyae TaxID=1676925 RepID=A0A3B3RVY9_9TELE